jgi:hypothetical protein
MCTLHSQPATIWIEIKGINYVWLTGLCINWLDFQQLREQGIDCENQWDPIVQPICRGGEGVLMMG